MSLKKAAMRLIGAAMKLMRPAMKLKRAVIVTLSKSTSILGHSGLSLNGMWTATMVSSTIPLKKKINSRTKSMSRSGAALNASLLITINKGFYVDPELWPMYRYSGYKAVTDMEKSAGFGQNFRQFFTEMACLCLQRFNQVQKEIDESFIDVEFVEVVRGVY